MNTTANYKNVTLDSELLNRIGIEAERQGMEPEEFVAKLLEDYLESTEALAPALSAAQGRN
ncbi:MAG: hypothetical protein SFV54_14210 [Bryobacteraceae bacterium]|nr:hypothetical protein [Bryobacteraceae bacterium]